MDGQLLAERLIPTPEDFGSNPFIGYFDWIIMYI